MLQANPQKNYPYNHEVGIYSFLCYYDECRIIIDHPRNWELSLIILETGFHLRGALSRKILYFLTFAFVLEVFIGLSEEQVNGNKVHRFKTNIIDLIVVDLDSLHEILDLNFISTIVTID